MSLNAISAQPIRWGEYQFYPTGEPASQEAEKLLRILCQKVDDADRRLDVFDKTNKINEEQSKIMKEQSKGLKEQIDDLGREIEANRVMSKELREFLDDVTKTVKNIGESREKFSLIVEEISQDMRDSTSLVLDVDRQANENHRRTAQMVYAIASMFYPFWRTKKNDTGMSSRGAPAMVEFPVSDRVEELELSDEGTDNSTNPIYRPLSFVNLPIHQRGLFLNNRLPATMLWQYGPPLNRLISSGSEDRQNSQQLAVRGTLQPAIELPVDGKEDQTLPGAFRRLDKALKSLVESQQRRAESEKKIADDVRETRALQIRLLDTSLEMTRNDLKIAKTIYQVVAALFSWPVWKVGQIRTNAMRLLSPGTPESSRVNESSPNQAVNGTTTITTGESSESSSPEGKKKSVSSWLLLGIYSIVSAVFDCLRRFLQRLTHTTSGS